MYLTELVILAALLQYLWFGLLVGRARGKYAVKAPAVTGNELFERYYRVQMNTMEQLVLFLPLLWLAARYWPQLSVAAVGLLFLVARFLYLKAYVKNPPQRILGFALTITANSILFLAIVTGIVRNFFAI